MPDRVIGIDLGTTNSVAAITRDGVPVLLAAGADRLLPSVVGISPEGEILVGASARNQWVYAPDRTVRSIKRRMGSGEEVQMAGRAYTPQEISAFILRELKRAADEALGEPVRRAVITVPAYFNEVQRQATLEAGEIAGFEVERVLNEPTAAALAYGYARGEDEHRKILVYDLGGGTFDISIIELSHGVVDVLATAGNNHLGGDDFDERIAIRLAEEFQDDHGIDLRQDHRAWARLLRAAEEAKIHLSDDPVTSIDLDYVATTDDGTPLHLLRDLDRSEFEELIADLLLSTGEKIGRALEDAGLEAGAIDRVLLVGGSTRIPAVWNLVAAHTGQDPHAEIDPDTAVALGAAVQAAIIAGEDVSAVLVDVTPLSLGIETARIAWGGHLSKDHFSPLIRRNTTIPVRKSESFTTLYPGQDAIHIHVYQGESPVASENVLLGDFRVEELEANGPDELAEVLVDFSLDVNGILDVTVTDRATRQQTRARLEATRQRLTPDEIARSQSRLAEAGTVAGPGGAAEEEPALDPGVVALVERARRAMESSDLPPGLDTELREAVARIRRGALNSERGAVEEGCDRLIDLLLDAEV